MGKALGLSDQGKLLWIFVRTRSEESAPTKEAGRKGFGTFRSREALMDFCEKWVRRVISHSVVKIFHKLEFTCYCILPCYFLIM